MKKILFNLNCKVCKKEYLYCFKFRNDFRCESCKKQNKTTLEDVERELREMSKEEYQSFMDDIKEYEESLKKNDK